MQISKIKSMIDLAWSHLERACQSRQEFRDFLYNAENESRRVEFGHRRMIASGYRGSVTTAARYQVLRHTWRGGRPNGGAIVLTWREAASTRYDLVLAFGLHECLLERIDGTNETYFGRAFPSIDFTDLDYSRDFCR